MFLSFFFYFENAPGYGRFLQAPLGDLHFTVVRTARIAARGV
jgi:hypothetical protein